MNESRVKEIAYSRPSHKKIEVRRDGSEIVIWYGVDDMCEPDCPHTFIKIWDSLHCDEPYWDASDLTNILVDDWDVTAKNVVNIAAKHDFTIDHSYIERYLASGISRKSQSDIRLCGRCYNFYSRCKCGESYGFTDAEFEDVDDDDDSKEYEQEWSDDLNDNWEEDYDWADEWSEEREEEVFGY